LHGNVVARYGVVKKKLRLISGHQSQKKIQELNGIPKPMQCIGSALI
jgi:hypothetical protein